MAEAFAVAASVISVASFAIQLADSVQKLCDFLSLVANSTEDLCNVRRELGLLSRILREISQEPTSGAVDAKRNQMFLDALHIAKEHINKLTVLATKLASKTGPTQGWMKRTTGRFRTALKAEEIEKLYTHIERAKTTLMLLQIGGANILTYTMNGKIDLLSASITVTTQTHPRITDTNCVENNASAGEETESSLGPIASASETPFRMSPSGLLSRTKTACTSINAGLARLTLQSSSTTFADPEDGQMDDEAPLPTKTTYVVSFLLGISSCRRGFRLSTTGIFDSMQLSMIRRRPNDSPIFTLCLNGDTRAVQKLIELGQASLFDANESGQGLLHIACRNGRSDLANLLLLKGVDFYMRSDAGDTAIDELEHYDGDNDRNESREPLRMITNTLVRETAFDPFDYHSQTFDTLSLYRGLPYEVLQYLLSQDSHLVPAKNMFDLIYENMHLICDVTDDCENSVNLMLTKYEKMMEDPVTRDQWPFAETLLQTLIGQWVFAQISSERGTEFKVRRCLMLTEDLYRLKEMGTTPLDLIARLDPLWVQPWLELLAENGINTAEYLQYEADQHPDGIVHQGRRRCCRVISLDFHRDEQGVLVVVEVQNVCDPRYAHFHPEYRCEASKCRERCITQLHDVLVDDTGKPLQNVPGSWSGTLIPNAKCFLVLCSGWRGKEYVDVLEYGDDVWNESSGEWEEYLG